MKPCKCKTCDEKFGSIVEGEAHGYAVHNLNWRQARANLEVLDGSG